MANNINNIDQEELDRIEDELLEKEAREREENMKVEGRGVFGILRQRSRHKDHKLQNNNQ